MSVTAWKLTSVRRLVHRVMARELAYGWSRYIGTVRGCCRSSIILALRRGVRACLSTADRQRRGAHTRLLESTTSKSRATAPPRSGRAKDGQACRSWMAAWHGPLGHPGGAMNLPPHRTADVAQKRAWDGRRPAPAPVSPAYALPLFGAPQGIPGGSKEPRGR